MSAFCEEHIETSSLIQNSNYLLHTAGFDTPREEHAGLLNQRNIPKKSNTNTGRFQKR